MRESLKHILVHCLDHTYDGKKGFICSFVSRDILNHNLCDSLALGFGVHFVQILRELQSYTLPSEACGWERGTILRHVHVLVQKPAGGFYTTVNVETPHDIICDVFKRVCLIIFFRFLYYFQI